MGYLRTKTMKLFLNLALCFLAQSATAASNDVSPTTFHPELIMELTTERPEKDPYETTPEYEQKLAEWEGSLGYKTVYLPLRSMRYDADYERFIFPFYCYKQCEEIVLDSTSYSQKFGSNAFGVTWAWNEQAGTRIELHYPEVENAVHFPMNRDLARDIGEQVGATIEIQVKEQVPREDRYSREARLGNGTSANINRVKFYGTPMAVHFIRLTDGEVLETYRFDSPRDPKDTSSCWPVCEPVKMKVSWPGIASGRGIGGECLVAFDIETSGKTSNVRLADAKQVNWLNSNATTPLRGYDSHACSPRGIFEKHAVKTLKKARFNPPERKLEGAFHIVRWAYEGGRR